MKAGKWIGRTIAGVVVGLLIAYTRASSKAHSKLDWYDPDPLLVYVDDHKAVIHARYFNGGQA